MTSIEWLVENLEKHHVNIDLKNTVVFDIAKEMHKQEIIEAWGFGNDSEPKETTDYYAEQYYNEI